MSEDIEGRYGYSFDEEHFSGGNATTRDEALGEAIDEANTTYDGTHEDERVITCWTAKAHRPTFDELIDGDWVLDQISEQLTELVGEAAENFSWESKAARAVEKAIAAALKAEGVELGCWQAIEYEEHTLVWDREAEEYREVIDAEEGAEA